MKHWLVKSDPESYGWSELIRDKKTSWDGVRNFAARNSIRAMQPGDLVLFYHSGAEKAVVGAATVLSSAYPDKTAGDGDWLAIDLAAAWSLKTPVPLERVKAERSLKDIPLVRLSRLSVMPIDDTAFDRIVAMGGGQAKLT